jgi:cytochrome c-type biogenesis protein CcmE
MALGAAALAASAYLIFSDTGEGVLEYVYVDRVVEAPDEFEGRTIKVHGLVVEGTVKQSTGKSGDYRFMVAHEGQKLAVHYTNLVPDTFQEGGEVVLTGQLVGGGKLFESDEMSAKCPSKYEAEPTVDDPAPKA